MSNDVWTAIVLKAVGMVWKIIHFDWYPCIVELNTNCSNKSDRMCLSICTNTIQQIATARQEHLHKKVLIRMKRKKEKHLQYHTAEWVNNPHKCDERARILIHKVINLMHDKCEMYEKWKKIYERPWLPLLSYCVD